MKHGDYKAMMAVANSVRVHVQHHTCCLDTGIEAVSVVLASFAMDKAGHNPELAIAELERQVQHMATNLRSRAITMEKGPR